MSDFELFKPEDFKFGDRLMGVTKSLDEKPELKQLNAWAAKWANAKFREWLEKQPVVFCRKDDGKWACDEHPSFARTTRHGRLVCVEDIER